MLMGVLYLERGGLPGNVMTLGIQLSKEAQTILNNPNAGGSSIRSEAYAMDILVKQYGAHGVQTEEEVKYYYHHWKKCDFITRFTLHDREINLGVSVTRAIFPKLTNPDDIDQYVAQLLYKKLSGLVISRAGSIDESIFEASLLFVWSPDICITNLLYATFAHKVHSSLKEDVYLLVVQASEHDLWTDFRYIK